MNLITSTEINTGRQIEFDYGRGIAIIGMVVCHTVMRFSPDANDLGYFIADNFFGGPIAAPLFMICLGVGLCYGSHNTAKEQLIRGLQLLFGSYLLNLIRGGWFAWLGAFATGDPMLHEHAIFATFIVDILQFAGVAFIFFSLMTWLKIHWLAQLALAVVFNLIGPYFEGFSTDNPITTAFLGLLIPSGNGDPEECMSCFPFSQWIIFPCFGVVFAKILRRVTDLKLFYRYLLYSTSILMLIYLACNIAWGLYPFSHGLYYWSHLLDCLMYIALDLFAIALIYFLNPYMPKAWMDKLENFSRNITSIYCISWCFILWFSIPVVFIAGKTDTNSLIIYPIGVFILFLSNYVANKWKAKKNRRS